MYKVLVLKELQKDVARAHRVDAVTVSQLVSKTKKNKKFISELLGNKEERENLSGSIGHIIEEMSRANTFIDSVAFVQKKLKEEHHIEAKEWVIKGVMKKDLDMKYKKVKPISIHANSPKNLVCWQQFALKFVELLLQGKRILNIDETWLGMSDFRYMKWQPAESTNAVLKLQLAPRISIITGLDSRG